MIAACLARAGRCAAISSPLLRAASRRVAVAAGSAAVGVAAAASAGAASSSPMTAECMRGADTWSAYRRLADHLNKQPPETKGVIAGFIDADGCVNLELPHGVDQAYAHDRLVRERAGEDPPGLDRNCQPYVHFCCHRDDADNYLKEFNDEAFLGYGSIFKSSTREYSELGLRGPVALAVMRWAHTGCIYREKQVRLPAETHDPRFDLQGSNLNMHLVTEVLNTSTGEKVIFHSLNEAAHMLSSAFNLAPATIKLNRLGTRCPTDNLGRRVLEYAGFPPVKLGETVVYSGGPTRLTVYTDDHEGALAAQKAYGFRCADTSLRVSGLKHFKGILCDQAGVPAYPGFNSATDLPANVRDRARAAGYLCGLLADGIIYVNSKGLIRVKITQGREEPLKSIAAAYEDDGALFSGPHPNGELTQDGRQPVIYEMSFNGVNAVNILRGITATVPSVLIQKKELIDVVLHWADEKGDLEGEERAALLRKTRQECVLLRPAAWNWHLRHPGEGEEVEAGAAALQAPPEDEDEATVTAPGASSATVTAPGASSATVTAPGASSATVTAPGATAASGGGDNDDDGASSPSEGGGSSKRVTRSQTAASRAKRPRH